jgi:outer membrane protein
MAMKRIKLFILCLIFIATNLAAAQSLENLDIDASIKIALKNNLNLQTAASKVKEAEAKLKETQATNRPQFSFQTTYTRMGPVPSFDIPAGNTTQHLKIGNEDNYNVGLTLQKAIATFGRLESSEKLNDLSLQNDKLEYSRQAKEIVWQVKKGYYDITRAQRLYQVANEAKANTQNHLKIAQANFKAGTVPRYDVLRAEVMLADAEQYLISAQNGVELSLANFKNILGIPLETEITTKTDTDIYSELSEAEYWEIALKNRIEFQQADLNIQIGEAMQRLAKANDKPNLSFATTYNVKNATVMTKPQSWTANVILNYPFYDSGVTKNKLKQAQEYTRQAVLLKEDLKRNIKLELKQAYLSLLEAKEKLKTTQKNVEQAQEALKIAEVRYQAGMGTMLELNDSQLALSNAEVNQTVAEFDLQVAFARLEKVTGSAKIEVGSEK